MPSEVRQEPWTCSWCCEDNLVELWPESTQRCSNCGKLSKLEYEEFTAYDGSEDWGFRAEKVDESTLGPALDEPIASPPQPVV